MIRFFFVVKTYEIVNFVRLINNAMGSVQLREELHQFINHADERVLNLLYDIVKADRDGLLTSAQQEDLDKRILRHKNGESKFYS